MITQGFSWHKLLVRSLKLGGGMMLLGLMTLISGCAEDAVVESSSSAPTCEVAFNGQAESGDLTGWTIIAETATDPWYVCSAGYFCTSWTMAQKSQEIDLLAEGFSSSALDDGPDISVSENFFNPYFTPSENMMYYLNVELRDADHAVITSFTSGTITGTSPGGGSETVSYTFSGYNDPANPVRYVYWEDGGKENVGWLGYYGARLNGASLNVSTASCQ